MAFDSDRHHRRSVRLREYDYGTPGAYFVTICTRGRMGTLGESAGERIVLSEAGLIAESTWESLPSRFPSVQLDAFIVMPDHLHGIVALIRAGSPVTLGHLIRTFKGAAARAVRVSVMSGFAWQRGYYERVVRDERELSALRRYIEDNPRSSSQDVDKPWKAPGRDESRPYRSQGTSSLAGRKPHP